MAAIARDRVNEYGVCDECGKVGLRVMLQHKHAPSCGVPAGKVAKPNSRVVAKWEQGGASVSVVDGGGQQ
jgi:hypothetical protein